MLGWCQLPRVQVPVVGRGRGPGRGHDRVRGQVWVRGLRGRVHGQGSAGRLGGRGAVGVGGASRGQAHTRENRVHARLPAYQALIGTLKSAKKDKT